jgi:PAS domain S-box-containing protein
MMLVIDLIIVMDVFVLLLIAMFLQHRHKEKITKLVDYATLGLNNLLDENMDLNSVPISDNEMIKFYAELKIVAETLRLRENGRKEILNIVNSMAVNIDLSNLLDDLLPKVLKATGSTCAAFYIANHATNKLEIKASTGFSKNIYSDFDMTIGEGLIGGATKETRIINDIPDDSVFIIRTFLGKIRPKSIMAIPIINNDKLVGVLTLASIYNYLDSQNEIIELIRYYVGISIGNAIAYEQTKRLTNELRFQNTLIQNLNEDLEKKVDNRTVFLNNIIDSIKDYAIYAIDVNHNITAWNKGAEQILGYSKDEIIGRGVDVIMSKADVKRGRIGGKIEAALRDGRHEESGWKIKKDGSSYFAEAALFPMYDHSGEVVGFTNVIKDVTYLKNVEKALGYEKEFTRKVFDTSLEPVIVTNQRGVIELANKKAQTLFATDNLSGQDLCVFFLEEEFLRRNLIDVAQRYGRGEWRTLLKNGSRPVYFSAYMLMESATGEPKLFMYLSEAQAAQAASAGEPLMDVD